MLTSSKTLLSLNIFSSVKLFGQNFANATRRQALMTVFACDGIDSRNSQKKKRRGSLCIYLLYIFMQVEQFDL